LALVFLFGNVCFRREAAIHRLCVECRDAAETVIE
jgi:hypothetical protein